MKRKTYTHNPQAKKANVLFRTAFLVYSAFVRIENDSNYENRGVEDPGFRSL